MNLTIKIQVQFNIKIACLRVINEQSEDYQSI